MPEQSEPDRPPSWLDRVRSALSPVSRRAADVHVNGADETRRDAASLARLQNVTQFESLRVDDVMVPRADVVAVEASATLSEVVEIFASRAHSRLPVFRESLDEPIGVVHIKDVVKHLAPALTQADDIGDKRVLGEILRPVLFVPPSMSAADLLLRMQGRRIHMAIVVDEYGGTDGLVTLEDLVEEIIGDIEDEHSNGSDWVIRSRGAHVWEADARAAIEDLEERCGRQLELQDSTEEVDTLGGLVFTLAGRVPERGEVIKHPAGLEFEVADADARRVRRLIVRVTEDEAQFPETGGRDSDANAA